MITLTYFNSIKVRLELRRDPYSLKENGFQFHKGAIRTHMTMRFIKRISVISIP
mgnify:CR=1 FL=1